VRIQGSTNTKINCEIKIDLMIRGLLAERKMILARVTNLIGNNILKTKESEEKIKMMKII